MAKFPKKPKNKDLSVLAQGSPIRMLMAYSAKRSEKKRYAKEAEAYKNWRGTAQRRKKK